MSELIEAMNTDLIQFVLDHPSHPGNIGGVARAIKTMGFGHLALVNPKRFPSVEATQRASGAADVLHEARLADSLAEAISDSTLVIGTSSRERSLKIPVLTPREAAEAVASEVANERQVSFIFGAENNGLSNDDLVRCHFHVMIPANPVYCSLNLASAVQLIAYELRCRLIEPQQGTGKSSLASAGLPKVDIDEPCTQDEMEQFYQHLESVLVKIGFLNPNNPRHLMARLKRLYNRAQPDQTEIKILRGVLALTEKNQSGIPSDANEDKT